MFFQPSKGIIALDIDGTVTAQAHEIDPLVIEALTKHSKDGWGIIFITGRPFQWAESALRPLPFPYAIAVQNGALLIEMPSRSILISKYLTPESLPKFKKICNLYETDFVIYSGLENDDWCYYCPNSFRSSELNYLSKRAAFLGEKWKSLHSFSDLPISRFTSIKFFVPDERGRLLSLEIEKELGLHAPPNRDPFDPNYFIIQATHPQANKGFILKAFIQMMGVTGPVICAGDDYNDESMLRTADKRIVMANAPLELLAMADVIAPPASELGIIQGLYEAIGELEGEMSESRK